MIIKDGVRELAQKLEPKVRAEFLKAIQDIKDSVVLRDLERAIAAGDVERALDLLNIQPGFFGQLRSALIGGFVSGGVGLLTAMPKRGARAVVRFDGGNPRAESWARSKSLGLIEDISTQTRNAARLVIEAGIREGRNPRRTALDLVGRIERGRRRGGIIGLSPDLADHLENARRQLRDPALMRGFLARQLRDRRYDARITRAISEGRALSQKDADTILTRYSDRLLRYRGERVARTETTMALNAGREEGMRQLIEAGGVRADQVKKRWKSALDLRTRDSHLAMHNQLQRYGDPFVTPRGAMLGFPSDPSLGAGPAEIVNCRCTFEYEVNW